MAAQSSSSPSAPQPGLSGAPSETDRLTERDQISQNLDAVNGFYAREDGKISFWQRALERISDRMGQPAFLGLILLLVVLWITLNLAMHRLGYKELDPPPFFWLQGVIGLAALLTSTIVLTKQNRLGKLDEQRDHLDLKVTLLTEQKTAKLIELIEELRRDLPNVKNRHDPEASALIQPMSPDLILAALDERGDSDKKMDGVVDAADKSDPIDSNG